MNYLKNMFFGVRDSDLFQEGLVKLIKGIGNPGVFAGDNLITWGKNLSLIEDMKFMSAVEKNISTAVEEGVIWRHSVVAWAAFNGLRLGEGDFVECACYKGTTAKIICDYLSFDEHLDREYYLYDLFEHDNAMPHHAMPEHSSSLFEQVKDRFKEYPNVKVNQGNVPAILNEVAPEKIAFMHLDLNNADAEIGALEVLFDRMLPGAVLVLDDYGWLAYRKQKLVEDPWLAKHGYKVLELPTGQGLLIK